MGINYSTVITKEDLEQISEEEYNNIKLICEAKNKADERMTFYTNNYKLQNAYEFAFRSKEFTNEAYYKKILIVSNLVYQSNDNIINILLSKDITYKKLSKTISRISRIKEALVEDETDLDENITISYKNLNTICNIIRRFYSFDDYNLIVAKLVEIVVFDKELYLSLEGGPSKTYTSKFSGYNPKRK